MTPPDWFRPAASKIVPWGSRAPAPAGIEIPVTHERLPQNLSSPAAICACRAYPGDRKEIPKPLPGRCLSCYSNATTRPVQSLPSLPHLLEGLVIGDAELVQPNLPGDGEEKERNTVSGESQTILRSERRVLGFPGRQFRPVILSLCPHRSSPGELYFLWAPRESER